MSGWRVGGGVRHHPTTCQQHPLTTTVRLITAKRRRPSRVTEYRTLVGDTPAPCQARHVLRPRSPALSLESIHKIRPQIDVYLCLPTHIFMKTNLILNCYPFCEKERRRRKCQITNLYNNKFLINLVLRDVKLVH